MCSTHPLPRVPRIETACPGCCLLSYAPPAAEVLGAFQAAVVALEQLLLEDDSCGLPGVQYQLVSWQVGSRRGRQGGPVAYSCSLGGGLGVYCKL
jgi:hypothetical protein